MKVFDTVTGVCLITFNKAGSANSIAFSPDDCLLAYSAFERVFVLDVQTGNLVQTFKEHTSSVVFSPCGTRIAGTYYGTLRIWNTSSGCCEHSLEGGTRAVCWSSTGNQVMSGSRDGGLIIWDVTKRMRSRVIHVHTQMVTSVAAFQDLVACGSEGGGVSI